MNNFRNFFWTCIFTLSFIVTLLCAPQDQVSAHTSNFFDLSFNIFVGVSLCGLIALWSGCIRNFILFKAKVGCWPISFGRPSKCRHLQKVYYKVVNEFLEKSDKRAYAACQSPFIPLEEFKILIALGQYFSFKIPERAFNLWQAVVDT